MTAYEQGFLLLASHLGQPDRSPLTPSQFRRLASRVRSSQPCHELRELTHGDLKQLGYGREDADRILALLDDTALLECYQFKAEACGCQPITRVSPEYPQSLRARLGMDAPICLWYRGSLKLLEQPMIAVVGSRDLRPKNEEFAYFAGTQLPRQGYTLVSGNARGADRTAQEACLASGGSVVCVIADSMLDHADERPVLYLSEDSFDFPFHSVRALSRNRLIHALGQCTLVAQCTLGQGGTWDGSVRNLRHGWSPLCCFDDGSDAAKALQDRGARLIRTEDLSDLKDLSTPEPSFF